MNLQFAELKHIYASPNAEPRPVLNIPDWEIQAGSQVLLKGVSGSGKTTLFNITAGLMKPTVGTVRFGEQALYNLPEAQRDRFRAQHIGYVFQNHYLLSNLTAIENVVMPLAFAGNIARRDWKPRAQAVLEKMGLADHLHYKPAKLSTGQRLRVAIARALVSEPTVLLADEPTAALDSESSEKTMDVVQTVCQAQGGILIVASHDPALDKRFSIIASLTNQQIQIQEAVSA